jgi:hypothetical protein
LRPGLLRIWRDESTLQLGVDAPYAVLITGVDAGRRGLLDALDGTRSRADLCGLAAANGLREADVDDLLAFLARHHLLASGATPTPPRHVGVALPASERARLAPDLVTLDLVHCERADARLARRRAARVDVHGAGRVGAAVATLVAAAGVGWVTVHDDCALSESDVGPLSGSAADVGDRRDAAAVPRIQAITPSTRTTAAVDDNPDVTVFAPDHGPDFALGERSVRLAGAHLVAYVRDTSGVVGPFVLPGRTPCLRCLDLHRADRDPGWPRVALQLARPGVSVAACDIALATLVASATALDVLTFLDGGDPASLGATIERCLRSGAERTRRWTMHPACGCSWGGAIANRTERLPA